MLSKGDDKIKLTTPILTRGALSKYKLPLFLKTNHSNLFRALFFAPIRGGLVKNWNPSLIDILREIRSKI